MRPHLLPAFLPAQLRQHPVDAYAVGARWRASTAISLLSSFTRTAHISRPEDREAYGRRSRERNSCEAHCTEFVKGGGERFHNTYETPAMESRVRVFTCTSREPPVHVISWYTAGIHEGGLITALCHSREIATAICNRKGTV